MKTKLYFGSLPPHLDLANAFFPDYRTMNALRIRVLGRLVRINTVGDEPRPLKEFRAWFTVLQRLPIITIRRLVLTI